MKIIGSDPVSSLTRVTNPPQAGIGPARGDRVTLEKPPASDAVAAASTQAATARAARLRQLSDAVKAGSYRPDASHVADQMLDAADLDAQLGGPNVG